MPRQLINIIGAVVCVGILALAIVLVAVPIFVQSLTTTASATQVDQTNAIYQAQVDGLRAESERMDEIQASVAELRTEIPATNQLDDVFELVARSADSADVEVISIAAGETAPFVVRTSPTSDGEEAAPTQSADATTGDATTDGTATDGTAADGTTTDGTATPVAPVVDDRVQVDFTLTVAAPDMDAALDFLDRLRGGPRLLGNVQSTVTTSGAGVDVTVSALTFVLPEN